MILSALGKNFSAEFSSCGHKPIQSDQAAKQILRELTSGRSSEVRQGLHQLSGHAKVEIAGTIPDQMRALVGVAAGVVKGDFAIDSHGSLLAASQFQAAKLGKEANRPVDPNEIRALYHQTIVSPRAQARRDFMAWIAGTSVAGLRESSAPAEADKLLKEILSDRQLVTDVNSRQPSPLREVLLIAAPKLCMPMLFECYDLALQFGSPRERGLGLHNVAKLPEIIRALGPNHPSRIALMSWSQRFANSVQSLADQPKVVVTDAIEPERKVGRSDVVRVLNALKAAGK
jgi:hypothetical protein